MDSQLQSNIYTVLVAGDVDLSEYDLNKKVKPYVVYEYKRRGEIRQQTILFYKEFIKNLDNEPGNETLKSLLNIKLQDIEEMSDEEYFEATTTNMMFDEKTGDALSDINPKGKYKIIYDATPENAVPLLKESFQCKIKELPIKTSNELLEDKYKEQWDYFMSCAKMIKNNYLKLYGNKETYVKVMTEPLFYNAFVSDETGWVEQCDDNQINWVLTFRERFIKNLHEDTVLKVYNFTR